MAILTHSVPWRTFRLFSRIQGYLNSTFSRKLYIILINLVDIWLVSIENKSIKMAIFPLKTLSNPTWYWKGQNELSKRRNTLKQYLHSCYSIQEEPTVVTAAITIRYLFCTVIFLNINRKCLNWMSLLQDCHIWTEKLK